MSAEPEPPRSLLGLVIALAVMLAVGLALFLPLFLWLPAPSMWRYLTWAAAFVGPLAGGELGMRLARRLGHPPHQRSLQQAAFVVILVLGMVSVLPFLTRT
jgi:hypothetical protein